MYCDCHPEKKEYHEAACQVATAEGLTLEAAAATRVLNTVPTTPVAIKLGKRKATDDAVLPSPKKLQFDSAARASSSVSSPRSSRASSTTAVGSPTRSEPIRGSDPVIIAHSPSYQDKFEQLPWGVQWMLARFNTMGVEWKHYAFADIVSLLPKKPKHGEEVAVTNKEAVDALTKIVAKTLKRLKADKNEVDTHGERGSPKTTKTTTALSPELEGELREKFSAYYKAEMESKSPWPDLDKEDRLVQEALQAGRLANLYLHDEETGWYGGQVNFTGQLKMKVENNKIVGMPHIELQKPIRGQSNRITRRFSSSSLIRIQIPREVFFKHGDFLADYFRRPFVIHGRVFRAISRKVYNVFLYQTSERWDAKKPTASCASGAGCGAIRDKVCGIPSLNMSFLDFVQWYNPIDINNHQTMAKWASRFALGLSNSVPGVQVAREDLHRIGDVVPPRFAGGSKVPTEMIMTDGCGFANGDFFFALREMIGWDLVPTAVQMRINGAKGLLVLHPDHRAVARDRAARRPAVWLRDSQMKIIHPQDDSSPADPALYTVDVLRRSYMSTPAHLSVETVINLAENGVSYKTFVELVKEDLGKRVDRLTQWTNMLEFWIAVSQEGGVVAQRLARMAAGAARSKGYIFEDLEEELDNEDVEELQDRALADQSTAWWDDYVSGSPSTLEETVLSLLDSGFRPDTCGVLRAKCRAVAERGLKTVKGKCRIAVDMSCVAFVIPDPLGVLEPGEVQIKSSTRNLLGQDGMLSDSIVGDVLLTRHPCKVPTDVQKAVAVLKPELREYVDVIIISTKGHYVNGELLERHLASMTGGGDYDGDVMEAFWQPTLVDQFIPADKKFADEPPELASCLTTQNESVEDFQKRIAQMPVPASTETRISEIQSYLLGAMGKANLIGTYSTMWENSAYANGYQHPETIRLANIFCKILDGGKTGVSVTDVQLKSDKRNTDFMPARDSVYKENRRKSLEKLGDKLRGKPLPPPNGLNLRRSETLGKFIMDQMQTALEKLCEDFENLIKERLCEFTAETYKVDEHLTKPWTDFVEKAKDDDGINKLAMEQMLDHVRSVWEEWEKKVHNEAFTDRHIVERQGTLRGLSQMFASGLDDIKITIGRDGFSVPLLLASCAYYFDYMQRRTKTVKWTRFPWDVAFRDLCEIKAKAVGPSKTVTTEWHFAAVLKPSLSVITWCS